MSITLDIDHLLSRCEEDGDCLVWTGALSGDGAPCANCHGVTFRVRGYIWRHYKGPVQADRSISAAVCGNKRCLNIDHLRALTRVGYMRAASRRGDLRAPPERVVAQQRLKRESSQAKLTLEQVREIRRKRLEEGATLVELAGEFGVHHSLIHRIVNNKAWRELATNASVFTYRPAA